MRTSVAAAPLLALALAGCGSGATHTREVRVLAPPGLVGNVTPFERATGCRVDLRVYDDGEEIAALADRRDADVVAAPVPAGHRAHDSVELVSVTLDGGLTITVPENLAAAFSGPTRRAGRRRTVWVIREEGENATCAQRWLAYATAGSGKRARP